MIIKITKITKTSTIYNRNRVNFVVSMFGMLQYVSLLRDKGLKMGIFSNAYRCWVKCTIFTKHFSSWKTFTFMRHPPPTGGAQHDKPAWKGAHLGGRSVEDFSAGPFETNPLSPPGPTPSEGGERSYRAEGGLRGRILGWKRGPTNHHGPQRFQSNLFEAETRFKVGSKRLAELFRRCLRP